MAPRKDVLFWTKIVGAMTATPFPNASLRGQAFPVLAPSASLVPRVVKVSPKLDVSRGVVVFVFVCISGVSNGVCR